MNKLISLFHPSVYYRRQEDEMASPRHDDVHLFICFLFFYCMCSYSLNKIISFLSCTSKVHANKASDLGSFLASHTGFSFLCQIFQAKKLCSNSIYFPSLNPVLPLPLHLNCSLKNYQLIPLC